ncbi:MAG: hypothetical protein AABX38_07975 [Candidatus Micrarchaeota archaeon]
MLGFLQQSFGNYRKKAKLFLKLSVFYLASELLASLAVWGFFFTAFLIGSLFGLTLESPIMIAIAAGAIILTLYIGSGLFGSYLKNINNILQGQKIDFTSFFRYGITKAGTYFTILVIKLLIEMILAAPLVALYLFALKKLNIPYIEIVLAAIFIGIKFFVDFIFIYSFISRSLFETSAFASIRNAFRIIRYKGIAAFGLYIIFSLTAITLLIPLLNIFTFFITLPVTLGSLILVSNSGMRK